MVEKPKAYIPEIKPRYNLCDIINYMDEKYKAGRKIWLALCDMDLIENDKTYYINFNEVFDNFKFSNFKDDILLDYLKLLFLEYPEFAKGDVLFDVSW